MTSPAASGTVAIMFAHRAGPRTSIGIRPIVSMRLANMCKCAAVCMCAAACRMALGATGVVERTM